MSNRQEVTRSVKSSRIFLKFSKKFLELPDLSRIVRKCQEVSGSVRKCQEVVQEVSKKILGSVKTLSSARFVLNFVKVGQL